MAIKTLRVFQEFTSAGYIPMPVAGNIDYGVTVANTFPATTPSTFQTDDPDIDVTLTATTDYYVWIRSHGTDWNPMYTRNVRVYPDSPLVNNVVMGIIIASLSNSVPYTGATANVNLGNYGITANYLGVNLTPSTTPTTAGDIFWDIQDGTLNVNLLNGYVSHLGGDLPVLVKSDNNSGLTKGSVVYQKGSDGANTTVLLAQANSEATSSKTFGIIANTTSGGAKAYCVTFGYVRGVDTSTLTEGATIYLSPTVAGGYTSTKPQAPNHIVTVGRCIKSHATVGAIFVSVQNGFEMDELHDVQIVGALNKDVLVYDLSTQLWKNRRIFKTQGYVPFYDDTLLLDNSPIYTNGNYVGIGTENITEKLTVNGNVRAAKFIKVGGASTDFLKGDGSSDPTAYQPLSADLTAIDALALTTGLLRKNGTDTWELDQTEYLSVANAISTYQTLANLSSNLTASTTKYPSVNAVNTGLALKLNLSGGTLTGGLTLNYSYPTIALSDVSSGTTWNILNDGSSFKLNYGATNKFYIFANGNAEFANNLTASALIKAGGTSTQFLKADGSVDSTTYQPYDADLSSIAGLALTTGLLRKNGANNWELDQTEYLPLATAISSYQTISNLSSNLTASSTKYPSVNAVNTGLGLKLNLTGGSLSGDLAISSSIPTLQFSDTSSGTIWNVTNDGGTFKINSGITNKFAMLTSGNASFVGDLTANKFIKVGGTSAQFLMADGSTSSGNAGTVTSVGLSAPVGFSVSGSPVTSSGTLALAFSVGYSLPSDATQATWTAKQNALNGTGFVKISGTTISYDNSTYYLASNPSGYISGITSLMVTNALGYTPYNSSNPSGYISGNQTVTLSGDVSGSGTTAITTTLATITQGATGSFVKITLDTKGRVTGNVAVGSSDITSALGYTPYNSTNPSGYISGITSGMVTTALGYTPVTNARTLTINGTAYDLSLDRSWTISGTIGGLTSGYIPKATSASTLGNSLIYDNGTNVIIGGTTVPDSGLKTYVTNGTVGLGNYLSSTVGYIGTWTNHALGFAINGTNKMTLDTAGNLGLGVTPSAWSTLRKVFSLGGAGNSIAGGTTDGALELYCNSYINTGGNYIYSSNGTASLYQLDGNAHKWFNAPSGTAGTAISFTQAMTLDASGDLMVGTTTSGGKLTVVSSTNPFVRIGNTSASDGGLKISYGFSDSHGLHLLYNPGSAIAYIDNTYPISSGQVYGNIYFRQNVGGTMTTRMMIKADGGNVGIGETSPSEGKLVINNPSGSTNSGVSGNTLYLKAQTANANLIRFSGAIATDLIVGRFGNADAISIGTTGGTEIARFLSSGNVGIGTTAPATKLEVLGTEGTGARTSPYNVLTVTAESPSVPYSGFGGGILFNNRAYTSGIVSSARIRSVINNNSVDTSGGAIAFDVTSTVGGTLTQAMLINYNGNVGIGTTSPAGRLTVSGANGAGISIDQGNYNYYGAYSHVFKSSSYTTDYMTIASTGNVLINTTTDSGYKLDVNGTMKVNSQLMLNNSVNNNYLAFNHAGTQTWYQRITTDNSSSFIIRNDYGGGLNILTLANTGAATFSSSVTATSFFESSDKTLKTLLVDNYQAKGIESIVAKLYTKNGKEELGYFAQDVQGILPSAVTKDSYGYLNLSYREVLVAKVQRLEKELEELKAKMN